MRLIIACFVVLCFALGAQAQVFNNDIASGCEIQVAFAISEADGTGEYVMTDLKTLAPGASWDFTLETLSERHLIASEDYEVMFIVRYPRSGMTFYFDANVPDGYEVKVTGCVSGKSRYYARGGKFYFETAAP